MIEYDKLYQEVKKVLSNYRFSHTEGVIKRALEYAEIYNVDKEVVKYCALAHDIAKEMSLKEQQKYIDKYSINLDEIEKENSNLIHAKIAGFICKYEYNFTDDMVNAVLYHTTGRENMSLLEKIIYLADATEENRKYNSKPYVDLIKKDIDLGMVAVSKWIIDDLNSKNKMIHPNSIKCYHYYESIVDMNEFKKINL